MSQTFALILAQAEKEAPAKGEGAPPGGGLNNILLFALPVLLLYLFIVVLPGRRRAEKERQEAMNKMEKGTEVVTIGGIYGTVISVSPDKDEMVIKVDDGTRLKMTKASIARNITAEEAAKKAKEEKSKPAAPAATPPSEAVTTTPTTPNK